MNQKKEDAHSVLVLEDKEIIENVPVANTFDEAVEKIAEYFRSGKSDGIIEISQKAAKNSDGKFGILLRIDPCKLLIFVSELKIISCENLSLLVGKAMLDASFAKHPKDKKLDFGDIMAG
ncbi:hypothetical protein KJ763_02115 [Patescibacteria group bacterium]|nr:hypothetical protein [Patescibacteria group bacterium]